MIPTIFTTARVTNNSTEMLAMAVYYYPRAKKFLSPRRENTEAEIERNRKVRWSRQEPLDRSSIVAEQSRSPTPRRNPKGEFVSLEPLTPPANRGRYSPTISLYSACPLSFSVPDSMLYDAQSMHVHACKHPGPVEWCTALVMQCGSIDRVGSISRCSSTCGSLVWLGRPAEGLFLFSLAQKPCKRSFVND